MENGQPLDFDKKEVSQYLQKQTSTHDTVEVEVSVGSGGHEGMAWGCDLSYDYVKINAEYTT
jgi:glutamate N-acetyltransferase / amino-acid N-acetyltransferase